MSVRAGIVITGTEVLTGQVRDRNGPWLADRLFELGIELAHVTICGDRPRDMHAQLRLLADQGCDLIITSGGLGPTADDLTLEVVAAFTGRSLALDEALEERIAKILSSLTGRWPNIDMDAVQAGNRKQALVPEGATVLEPVGTAPGIVVPPREGGDGPTVVVLPGPPPELRAMWSAAARTAAFRSARGAARRYDQSLLRLFGIPESEIAATLRVAESEIDGFERLEITTCLRRGEVEVVVRREPESEAAWRALEALISARHSRALFSTDGSSVDEQVGELLSGGHRLALAESCTAGLMSGRLAERPGSSAYLVGGVVVYADEAKVDQLGVPAGLIADHGAVSAAVAHSMASGALDRFGSDVALSITGIAGPGGGTVEKPVGTVFWCALTADGRELTDTVWLPGDRAGVRERSTTVGMHLLRRLLGADSKAS